MKLLIITSIREDLQEVTSLIEQAGIIVFSVSETIGHKTAQHGFLMDNWFGKTGDGADALFIFSFTDDDKARKAIELVKMQNVASKSDFPIRGFLLGVEAATF